MQSTFSKLEKIASQHGLKSVLELGDQLEKAEQEKKRLRKELKKMTADYEMAFEIAKRTVETKMCYENNI